MSELAKQLNDSIVKKDLVSVRSMLIANPDLYKHVEIRNKRYLEDNRIGNPKEISPPSPPSRRITSSKSSNSRKRTSSKSSNSMVELTKQLNDAIVNKQLDFVRSMLFTDPDLYNHVEIRNKRYLEDNRIGNPKEISPPSPLSRRRGKRGGSAMHRSAKHQSKTYKNKNNTKRRR